MPTGLRFGSIQCSHRPSKQPLGSEDSDRVSSFGTPFVFLLAPTAWYRRNSFGKRRSQCSVQIASPPTSHQWPAETAGFDSYDLGSTCPFTSTTAADVASILTAYFMTGSSQQKALSHLIGAFSEPGLIIIVEKVCSRLQKARTARRHYTSISMSSPRSVTKTEGPYVKGIGGCYPLIQSQDTGNFTHGQQRWEPVTGGAAGRRHPPSQQIVPLPLDLRRVLVFVLYCEHILSLKVRLLQYLFPLFEKYSVNTGTAQI
ncbi:uncharacterized protein BT62DRAFT_1008060 [Guyanagaster necrorhizus]|uniref:Uncharacterized protein n=1 Tax=Guyanagaster necrorhizus TaxID=856835 RepID=A0A9P8AS10_9AGAR|nr:uncharacterized protein BT62DRAFT_1008060 [Guyanagaster necrorhizus MCA 3950]KAG7444397.1 hypothetical protein BT62DRAFT_1008060 [Guyanagaster necrorhizus MCA 3950]